MPENSVKTGVDALLELLRKKQKISLPDAAKELKIQEETIKLWVDFLVEEKIIGVEYKFTKPYLYLNEQKKQQQGKIIEQEKIDINKFEQDFTQRATQSSIPEHQVKFLWKDHVLNQIQQQKQFFFREARKRGLENIDTLWEEYKQVLIANRQQNGTQ